MTTRRSRLWRLLQETPLELTLSLFLAIAACINLGSSWGTTSSPLKASLFIIAAGGLTTTAGRLRDDADVESGGLALLLAGLVFLLIRQFFAVPITWLTVAGLLVNLGAFVAGLSIRLSVVRRAARARRLAAKQIRGSSD